MWNILYDQGKDLCFVGDTGLNRQCMDMLFDRRCETVTTEELEEKNQEWFDNRQFISVTGDIIVKEKAVNVVSKKNGHFFSLVGKNNAIHPKTKIGVGSFINEYNDLLGESIIGDHVIVSCFCQFGREVTIENFCHISSYVYINNCHISKGVAMGLRSCVLGPKFTETDTKHIIDYCNLMANSVVTKNIDKPGTYFGNRFVNGMTRHEYRII